VDQISYGRLILGLGAGWHEPEFEEFGYEFEPPSVRVDRLRESVQIVRALLTGEHVTFDGQFYQLRAAALRPTPVQHPRPPIWVAARGQRMMQLTADYADGWNIAWQLTPQQYQAELERLLDACRAVGRDSSEITKTLGIDALIGRSE